MRRKKNTFLKRETEWWDVFVFVAIKKGKVCKARENLNSLGEMWDKLFLIEKLSWQFTREREGGEREYLLFYWAWMRNMLVDWWSLKGKELKVIKEVIREDWKCGRGWADEEFIQLFDCVGL